MEAGEFFVAISRFRVANGMEDQVRRAFLDRPHLVDDAHGFVRMEVMTPIESPEEFLLVTWWEDEASYREWHKSHLYRDSHAGIPRGLRLDPRRTEISLFVSFAD